MVEICSCTVSVGAVVAPRVGVASLNNFTLRLSDPHVTGAVPARGCRFQNGHGSGFKASMIIPRAADFALDRTAVKKCPTTRPGKGFDFPKKVSGGHSGRNGRELAT